MESVIHADKRTKSVKYILISVGVNDADTKSAEEIFEQAKKVVELAKHRYGNPKIVLAEATPRNDERDTVVKEYNDMIKSMTESTENMFLTQLSTLRTDDWRHYHDSKHITNFAVPIYCARIKRALREAYGIVPFQRRSNQYGNNQHSSYRGRGGGGGRNTRGGRFNGNRGNNFHRGGGYQQSLITDRNELEQFIRQVFTSITS